MHIKDRVPAFLALTYVGAVAAALCWVLAIADRHPARAQMPVFGSNVIPNGFCQIGAGALASATTFVLSCAGGLPANTHYVSLIGETANIRYRDDGVAPTTAVGMLLPSGATAPIWYAGNASALQFIAVSGSPILDASFYK